MREWLWLRTSKGRKASYEDEKEVFAGASLTTGRREDLEPWACLLPVCGPGSCAHGGGW